MGEDGRQHRFSVDSFCDSSACLYIFSWLAEIKTLPLLTWSLHFKPALPRLLILMVLPFLHILSEGGQLSFLPRQVGSDTDLTSCGFKDDL